MKRSKSSSRGLAKFSRLRLTSSSSSSPKTTETITKYFTKEQNTQEEQDVDEIEPRTPLTVTSIDVSCESPENYTTPDDTNDFTNPNDALKWDLKVKPSSKNKVGRKPKTTDRKKTRQTVLKQSCKADEDDNDLQLALALSKSCEQEAVKENLEENESFQNTQEKILLARKSLAQFVFTTSNAKLEVVNRKPEQTFTKRKQSRFKRLKPIIFIRTEEDRQKIIQEKIAKILLESSNFKENTENPEELVVYSDYLCGILNEEATLFKKNSLKTCQYTVNSLNIKEKPAKSGYLLKDWSKIPGRTLSPSKNTIKTNLDENNEQLNKDECVMDSSTTHLEDNINEMSVNCDKNIEKQSETIKNLLESSNCDKNMKELQEINFKSTEKVNIREESLSPDLFASYDEHMLHIPPNESVNCDINMEENDNANTDNENNKIAENSCTENINYKTTTHNSQNNQENNEKMDSVVISDEEYIEMSFNLEDKNKNSTFVNEIGNDDNKEINNTSLSAKENNLNEIKTNQYNFLEPEKQKDSFCNETLEKFAKIDELIEISDDDIDMPLHDLEILKTNETIIEEFVNKCSQQLTGKDDNDSSSSNISLSSNSTEILDKSPEKFLLEDEDTILYDVDEQMNFLSQKTPVLEDDDDQISKIMEKYEFRASQKSLETCSFSNLNANNNSQTITCDKQESQTYKESTETFCKNSKEVLDKNTNFSCSPEHLNIASQASTSAKSIKESSLINKETNEEIFNFKLSPLKNQDNLSSKKVKSVETAKSFKFKQVKSCSNLKDVSSSTFTKTASCSGISLNINQDNTIYEAINNLESQPDEESMDEQWFEESKLAKQMSILENSTELNTTEYVYEMLAKDKFSFMENSWNFEENQPNSQENDSDVLNDEELNYSCMNSLKNNENNSHNSEIVVLSSSDDEDEQLKEAIRESLQMTNSNINDKEIKNDTKQNIDMSNYDEEEQIKEAIKLSLEISNSNINKQLKDDIKQNKEMSNCDNYDNKQMKNSKETSNYDSDEYEPIEKKLKKYNENTTFDNYEYADIPNLQSFENNMNELNKDILNLSDSMNLSKNKDNLNFLTDNIQTSIQFPNFSNENLNISVQNEMQNTSFNTEIDDCINLENLNKDKYVVKTKNVPAMPNYDSMMSEELQKELSKFGIKPLKDKKAVNLLKYIYNSTHPLVKLKNRKRKARSSNKKINSGASTSKSDEFGTNIQHGKGIEIVGDKLLELENPSHLIFERKVSSKIPSCALPLQIAWHNFLCLHPEIRENILFYEPIQIEVIHNMLKELGHKYHQQDLLTFFDRKCITIRINHKR